MGFRWGFQWHKVISGGVMLLIGGGVSLAFLLGGRISIWGLVLALIGICAMISGLIGEDAVW